MEIKELLENLTISEINIKQAIRLVKKVDYLSGDHATNFLPLKSNLTKLETLSNKYANENPLFRRILTWVEKYNGELVLDQEHLKDQFGIILERELVTQGYILKGNYPKFTAGIFTIETNHKKWYSKIWYGPKQELLTTCSFSASMVVSRIKVAREILGTILTENDFLDLLFKIYMNLVQNKHGETVPIDKIRQELAKTNPPFRVSQSSQPSSIAKLYGRADLSYDLFRIRDQVNHPELVVATRFFTKKRTDFLWVPVDENGKGAFYSHLKF